MATSMKARLRASEQLLGALLRVPAEETVEMLGVAGLDFLVIDCEHGPADLTSLRHHLALAELHGLATLVRVGTAEPALVLRVLDAGAQGVIAPHIDTVDQAAALVDSAHYPPQGHRGFATYGRGGRFGMATAEEHQQSALADTLVIAMLESPTARAAAASILGVPGIDGYLVGAADLRAASGPDDPPVPDQVAEIHRVAAETGVLRMELVGSAAAAHAAQAGGAPLVCYNLTQVLMGVFAELALPQG